jgi:copper oxidase (laccase) domain-containing protein
MTLHVGFKGLLNGITQAGIQKIKTISSKKNISAYISPHIHQCCYEVSKASDKRVSDFQDKYGEEVIEKKEEKTFINLHKSLRKELQSHGMLNEHIFDSHRCTACTDGLPSHYKSTFIDQEKRDTVLLTIAYLR